MCENHYIIKTYLNLVQILLKHNSKLIFKHLVKSSSLNFLIRHLIKINELLCIKNIYYMNVILGIIFKSDQDVIVDKIYIQKVYKSFKRPILSERGTRNSYKFLEFLIENRYEYVIIQYFLNYSNRIHIGDSQLIMMIRVKLFKLIRIYQRYPQFRK